MSSDSYGLEISDFELRSLTQLGADSQVIKYADAGPDWDPYPPSNLDEAGQEKWRAKQEEEKQQILAERAKRDAEEERRRKQAEDQFKAALDERIKRAYQQGAAQAVSREALRAVSVRSYVLLGVVAAVVAMPLIAMFFKLDPQAFGAYIAPVTGITGTIVGYWFGTVGQASTGQGATQISQDRSSKRDAK